MKSSFRLTEASDMHLPAYDNTALVAVSTCPVWGITRYRMHKRMPTQGRATALECGTAMHEVFAFVRLMTLKYQLDEVQGEIAFRHHGERLFGAERLLHLRNEIIGSENVVEASKRGAIAVLDTSGYYDEPRDKRRTLVNMEESALAYINRWQFQHHVWMRDPTDPTSDVGIEWPFDMVVTLGDRVFRHTGRIDGIHHRADRITLHDNKTASRLNDAWAMSFETSSQVTAYCVAASLYTQELVNSAEIHGLAIPMPKSYDYGGIVVAYVSRETHQYERWLNWLDYTVALCEKYEGNPYDAPMFTHSCNRYFRPCSMIPFCASDREEQELIISQMEVDEWSPLTEDKDTVDG